MAKTWLSGSAASGNTRLAADLAELAALWAAHGDDALIAALDSTSSLPPVATTNATPPPPKP